MANILESWHLSQPGEMYCQERCTASRYWPRTALPHIVPFMAVFRGCCFFVFFCVLLIMRGPRPNQTLALSLTLTEAKAPT